jgi:RNA polymerase I-specific transcription initiation factor RRN3
MSSASGPNSSSGESGTGQSLHASLNTFFPFDPFNLPRSCSYIHPVYRDWTSVAIDESDDENGDEDEDEDEEDKGEGEGEDASEAEELGGISFTATKEREATDGLGESFGGMSISPIRRPPTLSTVPVI